jgi:hypothetical protein
MKKLILFLTVLMLASLVSADVNTAEKKEVTTKQRSDFTLEALTDFVDNTSGPEESISAQQIRSMMAILRQCGIKRMSWSYYGDGHGGYLHSLSVAARTYQSLGNPLRVAVEAAHAEGMELYAYYKPYETGLGSIAPEGSIDAMTSGRMAMAGGRLTGQVDRFVVDNPHLRIKRRTDDLPADIATIPICSLKLIKKDDSPTRVTKEHLQIWASNLNNRYQQLDIDFDVKETVEKAKRDVYDSHDNLITKKGAPVRVLTLSGLNLTQPYILVTTDFTEGQGDFENIVTEMLVAFDKDGRKIPGVFSDGWAIWGLKKSNFRGWGLFFDYGFGRERRFLDTSNRGGKLGQISFTRGGSKYLSGALCETEPEVRDYWLSCVDEMLDAGVDGIDFRIENHSTHTDYPENYGFNPAVLEECARRGSTDLKTIAKVRGEAYTEFLRQAKKRIAARGKRMRINLNVDWFRPEPDRPKGRRLAYPANIDFEWQRWIEEGLLDEAILRFFAVGFDRIFIKKDAFANKMIDACNRHNIPITVNKYIWDPKKLQERIDVVVQDGRFSGFILYETARYTKFGPKRDCFITKEEIKNLKIPQ